MTDTPLDRERIAALVIVFREKAEHARRTERDHRARAADFRTQESRMSAAGRDILAAGEERVAEWQATEATQCEDVADILSLYAQLERELQKAKDLYDANHG